MSSSNLYTFSQLLVEAELTGSEAKRQALLEDYLSTQDDETACWAIYLLSDKQRTRYLKAEELKRHYLNSSDMPEWLFDASNAHVEDVAECISLILKTEKASSQQKQESELSLNDLLTTDLPAFKTLKTVEKKTAQLTSWWQALSGNEVYVLNKLLTGSFRGGNLKAHVIPALASTFDKSETAITYALSNKYVPSSTFFNNLKDIDSSVSEPYAFQQAIAWQGRPDSLENLHFEWKYDGLRAQLIKRNDEVFLWSKNHELLNQQFPEIVTSALSLENGTVFDGEIVGWEDGHITMMSGLRGRLERKTPSKQILNDHPIHYKAFDLLEHKGISTQNFSFTEKQHILAAMPLPQGISPSNTLVIENIEDLENKIKQARSHHADGIIIRHKTNNTFWRYQTPPHNLKVVLTYVQGNILSFALRDNAEFITFTKIEYRLSTKPELKTWIKQNSLERFGPVTSVKAEQVFKIAFDSIVESKRHKSGLAVKNPRIITWLKDSKLENIDTLATAQALLD